MRKESQRRWKRRWKEAGLDDADKRVVKKLRRGKKRHWGRTSVAGSPRISHRGHESYDGVLLEVSGSFTSLRQHVSSISPAFAPFKPTTN